MRTLEGAPLDIAITTNGHSAGRYGAAAGRCRLESRHGFHGRRRSREFARITRVPNGYERVLAGIRAAQRAGLNPVKINCVLLRGFNDDQITAFGRFAREEGVVVRFIEFMPLEEDRVWSPEIVVTLDEIVRRMAEFMPLREIGHAAARPRAVMSSTMASARSASSRRCRIPSAAIAAEFASPPMAKSAPACSRSASTIWPLDGAARATTRWPNSSFAQLIKRKSATTSASPDSFRHRGRWCISAGERPQSQGSF